MNSRRDFLQKTIQGAALATSGGLLWSYLVQRNAQAVPFALRPPGALPEADFNALCIKCGRCVAACPYATLQLAPVGVGAPLGTPYFQPRQVPCRLCQDIPCQRACPTGALSPQLTEITAARMGLAVIDTEHCLSWQGLRCEICYRVCPLREQAITIDARPRRLSKHAMLLPTIHSDACTGCGICEQACPAEVAAIRILPHAWVQGKIGDHYRLGWKQTDGITQTFTPALSNGENSSSAGGLDYLNDPELKY